MQAADRGYPRSMAIALAVIAVLQIESTTAEEKILRLDPETTEITFTLGTTSGRIDGSFRIQESEVRFDSERGLISGRVVADATSGDSGMKRRNRNMHVKVLESERYPEIVFLPERFDGIVPADGHGTIVVHGALEIHGGQHRLSIQVEIDVDGDQLTMASNLRIPYIDWGLRDPSVFVHRVEKHVNVTVRMIGRLASGLLPEDVVRLAAVAHHRCKARGFPAGKPSRSFVTDGCTGWPDDVVLNCCIDHDMAYWCGGSREDRKRADAALRNCVVAAYGEWPGPVLGWMMQAGVSSAGSPHLPTYWRWGYGHAFGGGYSDGSEAGGDHPE